MAQTKKSTARKSSPAKKSTAAAKPTVQDSYVPIRRELTGVCFFVLAVFIGVSFFRNEGSFITFFSNFMKSLIGWGYWLSAPMFLIAAFILLFHRGRPVQLRVICALLIPLLFSCVMSLTIFTSGLDDLGAYDFKIMCGILFERGQNLASPGLFSGLIAYAMKRAFSVWGALPVLSIALLACIVCAFNVNLGSAAGKVKRQMETKYDPAMYRSSADEEILRPISSVDGGKHKTKEKLERVSRASYFDIPLDEETDYEVPKAVKAAAAKAVKAKKVPIVNIDDEDDGFEDIKPINVKPAKAAAVKPLSAKEAAKIAGVELQDLAPAKPEKKPAAEKKPVAAKPAAGIAVTAEINDPPKKKIPVEEVKAETESRPITAKPEQGDYEFPPVTLLRSGASASGDYTEELAVNRERLESAIHSFGISARVVDYMRGPTVTRYDVELDQGVKLSRITNLAGDLALALGVINVRIAPIPDKISTVGIEVPNKIISTVYLRDIIDSPQFCNAKSRLSFSLGKDISGSPIVGNIAKMPHLLIAGTTGSGKSVCMNSLILSLLFKSTPEEVRLVMIDPKMVELGIYNGIPHLDVPVVTDPKKASGVLQWSVVEMLKRYRLFSEVGVRDLENYNKHCRSTGEATMPQIVIVIDELADLMMVASKEVEESICRVAQMGRAAGMHLVIATQRPSADVITGLMKANIPSRIAFAVSSAMESRIILDQGGAEKLIGMGDMLFSPVGCGKPTRIQGAFVSDEEREDVIMFIKDGNCQTSYNSEIEDFMNKAVEDKKNSDSDKGGKDDGGAMGGYDEMLPQAVEVVLETKSCSVSMLQRRVKLGYSRAARIVDQMEELGIVGPYEGAKPRSVIIDREGWNEIQRRLGLRGDSDMSLAAELSDDF